ncbi:MAG: ABC transporter ATP-binding protein [Bryobacterales bacterium]|nr:ABC transporter ATP-binding protein [Bryobacterales bacterium]
MNRPPYPVEASRLSKRYPLFSSPSARLRQLLFPKSADTRSHFWALRDLSFEVERGETFCIVGQNGSGKSTLLQLIASIIPPTEGELTVRGRLAALLELGAGFNPDFTGRENVLLNAALLGFSSAEIAKRMPEIEDFAEIGAFVDQPVKTYSSGMLVRLAFAVAVHLEPDLLLVDEALAVGDIYFRQRCMRKVHELKRSGTTILYVTHSAQDVRAIGDRCLWLDHGLMRECGDPETVVSHYLAEMTTRDGKYVDSHPQRQHSLEDSFAEGPPETMHDIPNIDHRFGDGRAEVIGVALTDASGKQVVLLHPHREVVFRMSILAKATVPSPIAGYVIRNHLGLDLAASNTLREGVELPSLEPGQTMTVDFHLTIPELYPAAFSFTAAIADGDLNAFVMCDWVENVISVAMDARELPVYGYLHLPCHIGINQRLASVTGSEVLHG